MNKPASARHLTVVCGGNINLKLSQCKIDAKPPAEHPERSAYKKLI